MVRVVAAQLTYCVLILWDASLTDVLRDKSSTLDTLCAQHVYITEHMVWPQFSD